MLTNAVSQNAIGTWEVFNAYHASLWVSEGDEYIYSISGAGLMAVKKSDHTITTFDKANSLSDDIITHTAYNAATKSLLIVYENSNIDLLVNNTTVYNIPDIKNKVITGSKTIHKVISYGNKFYLASDIGISELNIERKEIANTFVIGNNGENVTVTDISIDNGKIYAATQQGLKVAQLNNPLLQNYQNWTLLSGTNGLPVGATVLVNAKNDYVATVVKDSVFEYKNSNWQYVISNPAWDYAAGFKDADGVYFTVWNEFEPRFIWLNNGFVDTIKPANSLRPLNFVKSDNQIWCADLWFGLLLYNNNLQTYQSAFIANSPQSNASFDLKINDHILYMAPGGIADSYLPSEQRYIADGPTFLKDGLWYSFRTNSQPALHDVVDLLTVDVDKINNVAYFGSHGKGIVAYDVNNGTFTNYNADNSPVLIKNIYGQCIVSALACDKNGNTWMHNKTATKALVVKTPDGQWANFIIPSTVDVMRKMIIDSRGYIWTCQRGDNIVVYDPGDDVLSNADDRMRVIYTGDGQGALPDKNVWCIAEDLEGDMWVGTDAGIGTFYCASNIFGANGCDADKIKVERDGYIGYLFSTESVRAIAVDPANRKWVGTTNGVWLISADGKNELLKFNVTNSPLPSNNIKDIEVDFTTGKVYIATENGLVAYQGDAIEGVSSKPKAFVYPNPVTPAYTGNIAIKGLVQDAYVKITDAGGILVMQGKANGGQYVWDGNGYNGKRVQAGVYIVYSATELGKERAVGKIIFID